MKLKNISLFTIYVALSLVIGEFHPFSQYEMYSNFPNQATAFYLSAPNGQVIPLQSFFHYKTADISHNYSAIKQNFSNANDSTIGAKIFSQLLLHQIKNLPYDTIQLNKVEFSIAGALNKKTETMYEYHP